jgi:hypothetical protein
MRTLILMTLLSIHSITFSQQSTLNITTYDGIIVAGYVNIDGFLNFTGPIISATHKESKIILSMLPSLRFKEDKGATKNTLLTPALGLGLTYTYKYWVFQLPIYYNPKTQSFR